MDTLWPRRRPGLSEVDQVLIGPLCVVKHGLSHGGWDVVAVANMEPFGDSMAMQLGVWWVVDHCRRTRRR